MFHETMKHCDTLVQTRQWPIQAEWRITNLIGSDDGLSHERRQGIIWFNAGILLIGALGTEVSEIFNRN